MSGRKVNLNSIRVKLIVSLILICVVPLIALGVGSYIQSKSILNSKLTVTSTQAVSQVSDGLNDYFKGFLSMTNMASKNFDVVNADDGNNFSYVPEFEKNIKDSDNDILDVYYGTESGKFYMYPEAKLPDGYDARKRGWYKSALDGKGKVVITPPYQDAGTGSIVVGIVKAVEKDGKTVGVIGFDCSLKTLTEKIASKKIGNTGYLFISDADGNILAHPNTDLLNTNEATKLSIWDKVKSEHSGFISYNYDGRNKFGVYDTNELTGWKLVATLDEGELTNDTKSILVSTIIIILVMTLIAIGLSILLSRGISNNIKMLKEVFAKASNGDLTVKVKATTRDEFNSLAVSFNSMMENIVVLMNNATKSSRTVLETSTSLAAMSEEISASVSEVAKAIEDVSAGATEQVQNAQNGATQMDELSKQIDEISSNSIEMDKISSGTKDLSSKGLHMIDTLIEKSNKTKSATMEVNNIVRDMDESTRKINAISETIAEITEQTNLLSLNASIESARAGEAGKGFAVVAEEIRKLAEESKGSTEEIKAIIASIQEKSDVAVKSINLTQNVVNEQDLAVSETKQIFSEILKSIELMIKKVDEIKISIGDMDKKKKSTVSKIENISFISEQTASASEEVTASAEEIAATMEELTNHSNELKVLAEQLESEISKFKTN